MWLLDWCILGRWLPIYMHTTLSALFCCMCKIQQTLCFYALAVKAIRGRASGCMF